eukprot:g43086.t1
MANVTFLFKKGRRSLTGHYRPVSLTLVVGKILEFIIKNKIAEYVEVHGKIELSQHSFIKGKSCLTNLLKFFDKVTNKLDKGEPEDVIYLDFWKAFDK